MREHCQRYLDDPEANPGHLDGCSSCREMTGRIDAVGDILVAARVDSAVSGVDTDALPLAPWEGANHRSWILVATTAMAILLLALVLFTVAGVAPADGFRQAVVGQFSPGTVLRLVFGFGETVLTAPVAFHVAVAGAFILINLLFLWLLRRSPKGIDASSR